MNSKVVFPIMVSILISIAVAVALINCSIVDASIGKKTNKTGNLFSLRKKISQNNKIISKLDSRIIKLERKLEKGNSHYLNILKEKSEIEGVIFNTRSDLTSSREKLDTLRMAAQGTLNGMILNALEEEQDAVNLMGKRLLEDELRHRLGKLKEEIGKIDELGGKIQNTEKKLASLLEFEKVMSAYLVDLEKKKKNAARKYLGHLKNKDMLQVRYDNIKARLIVSKKKRKKDLSGIRFTSPLKEYVGLKYKDKKKKGITYRFEGVGPVLASRKGEIVHSGSLASYGNIVIIKHENDLRSVIFGDFLPKRQKGAQVVTGDIIGYTKKSRTGYGQVYFEVRNKNQVQDTVMMMDKEFLSKASSWHFHARN